MDPGVLFIGLNPSTADETVNDPTIRRCMTFAKKFGGGRLIMANLFALRATDPYQMLEHPEPIGPDNDHWLRRLAREAGITIAAWGVHGQFRGRAEAVRALLPSQLFALGLTKEGHPRHPLYLPGNAELQPYG
jgi:hypothetical protein